jgi:hypothetical protein
MKTVQTAYRFMRRGVAETCRALVLVKVSRTFCRSYGALFALRPTEDFFSNKRFHKQYSIGIQAKTFNY